MSVYTPINQQQLKHFLNLYSIGNYIDFSGIKAGIENTNYVVYTTRGKFILTIFESLTEKELPCYLGLLSHLCKHGFPAPHPLRGHSGSVLHSLKDKPAAIFTCLPGQSIDIPLTKHCAEIGSYLARLHLSTCDSNFHKPNIKNLAGCQSIFNKINTHLSDKDRILLSDELCFQRSFSLPALPQGVIHADLFRDNVLFEQDQLSGIVDFYNACHDYFIFDIAITVNDWCLENNAINPRKFKALLNAYQKIRPLNKDEEQYLKLFLRLAALRFFLSRLDHQLNPKVGELVQQKDPLVFRRLLSYHQKHDLK